MAASQEKRQVQKRKLDTKTEKGKGKSVNVWIADVQRKNVLPLDIIEDMP